ncbi:hypothetical protein WME98_38200 [Sorangium sp. So ce296]|uniref:hypothetical protein n=1 Tax=Sorangium sp. So ce296 TaxID=3133296 RepID=UPI003F5E6BEF
MTYLIPSQEQAHAGLRAIKGVLTSAGPLDGPRRDAIAAVQRHLLHTAHDIDALAPIAPEALAAAVREPALREQLVSGLCAMTLCGERIDERELLEVERFAAALGARPPAVRQLQRLYERRLLLLRIDISRNALLGKSVRRMLDEGGASGLARNLASFPRSQPHHRRLRHRPPQRGADDRLPGGVSPREPVRHPRVPAGPAPARDKAHGARAVAAGDAGDAGARR